MYLIPEFHFGYELGFKVCYGVTEAARIFGVTPGAIEGRIRNNSIESVKINGVNHITENGIGRLKPGHCTHMFEITCDHVTIPTSSQASVGYIMNFLAEFFDKSVTTSIKKILPGPIQKKKHGKRSSPGPVLEVLDKAGHQIYGAIPSKDYIQKNDLPEKTGRILYLCNQTSKTVQEAHAYCTEERFQQIKEEFLYINPKKVFKNCFSNCEFTDREVTMTKDVNKDGSVRYKFHNPTTRYWEIE